MLWYLRLPSVLRMLSAFLNKIGRLDAHHRLLIALAVTGFVILFVMPAGTGGLLQAIIGWITFAVTTLLLAWTTILTAHPRDLPKESQMQDSSRILILVFVVVAALASLMAVVVLLDGMDKTNRLIRVLLAVLAVSSAWGLVHTVFTIRYAHLFYGNDQQQRKKPGGLDFPNEPEPDYLDFAYFSFVIGMTSQVSDVAISGRSIRRLALAHGVLSFGFNAIIIALTISGLSGVLG